MRCKCLLRTVESHWMAKHALSRSQTDFFLRSIAARYSFVSEGLVIPIQPSQQIIIRSKRYFLIYVNGYKRCLLGIAYKSSCFSDVQSEGDSIRDELIT